MIGRKFDEDIIKKELKGWPFKVEADEKNRPVIKIEDKKKKNVRTLYPEEV